MISKVRTCRKVVEEEKQPVTAIFKFVLTHLNVNRLGGADLQMFEYFFVFLLSFVLPVTIDVRPGHITRASQLSVINVVRFFQGILKGLRLISTGIPADPFQVRPGTLRRKVGNADKMDAWRVVTFENSRSRRKSGPLLPIPTHFEQTYSGSLTI